MASSPGIPQPGQACCSSSSEATSSADGDHPGSAALIDINCRQRSSSDGGQAHDTLGVLGETGKGSHELPTASRASVIDIWMGRSPGPWLDCGGYIAGEACVSPGHPKICRAPDFVCSVGVLASAFAAAPAGNRRASLQKEPERVTRLRERAHHFLEQARQASIDLRYFFAGQ